MAKIAFHTFVLLFAILILGKADGAGKCSEEYVFQSPIYPPPLSYLDENGTFTGMYKELMYEVCKVGRKICDYTLVPVQKCMEAGENLENIAGDGLMGEHFDGCLGFGITTEREQQVAFSTPFSPLVSNMMVLPGSPLINNPNMTGKNVAFAGGQLSSPACLREHGVDGFQEISVSGHAAGMALLNSGEADALFNSNNALNPQSAGLVIITPLGASGPDMVCIEGTALMTKKGKGTITWWNSAFQEYKRSGGFLALCQKYVRIGREYYKSVTGVYPQNVGVDDICLL